jgi:SagB-type dehydrogenase family enzyme
MPKCYLSPYAVFCPEPDNTGVELRHALHGTRFSVSADSIGLLLRFLGGADLEETARGAPQKLRDALSELRAERILLDEDDFAGLDPHEFRDRLNPIEHAFERGLNEGEPAVPPAGSTEPPPPDKRIDGAETVDLDEPYPDGSAHLPQAMGLAECLEKRQSLRTYGKAALPLDALERFLHLTARAYATVGIPGCGQISLRNYPSGGARYPIEVYPVINSVSPLRPGIYHYAPFQHRLVLVNATEAHRQLVNSEASIKLGNPDSHPAVLFILTAVFGRTCWKYRNIPLHLIHQEVGALYQTMYLAATYLDLAPCAIGAFPELAIDEMLGLDARDESQVGLFALGPRPEDPPPPLLIGSVRKLNSSPFSRRGRTSLCVELEFENGFRETVELRRLQLTRDARGNYGCRVMRARLEARFQPRAAQQLEAIVPNLSLLPDMPSPDGAQSR